MAEVNYFNLFFENFKNLHAHFGTSISFLSYLCDFSIKLCIFLLNLATSNKTINFVMCSHMKSCYEKFVNTAVLITCCC